MMRNDKEPMSQKDIQKCFGKCSVVLVIVLLICMYAFMPSGRYVVFTGDAKNISYSKKVIFSEFTLKNGNSGSPDYSYFDNASNLSLIIKQYSYGTGDAPDERILEPNGITSLPNDIDYYFEDVPTSISVRNGDSGMRSSIQVLSE